MIKEINLNILLANIHNKYMENMDNNQENVFKSIPPKPGQEKLMDNGKKCCGHSLGHHGGHCQGRGCRFLRPFLILLVAIIIFLIGVSFGAHFSREREYRGFYNQRGEMMNQAFDRRFAGKSGDFQGGVQTVPAQTMMWRAYSQTNGQPAVNLLQLVGAITKIEGNKITLGGNGIQPVTFNISSSTPITNASGPISLNALKVGQNIVVVGSSDVNQQVNAQAVNVQ